MACPAQTSAHKHAAAEEMESIFADADKFVEAERLRKEGAEGIGFAVEKAEEDRTG
ncbi:hypothetical protein VTI74DRAFT_2798 [Chaetomium olivicolor]